MSGGSPALVTIAGAAAGGLVAVAAREAVLASPVLTAWLRLALEPLRRAGREGYVPSTLERRRLAGLGTVAAILVGWFLAGPEVALTLAVAGPGLAGWAVGNRRRRYRAAVERALPDVAAAVADSLSAGRSLRASLPAAAASLDGPAAVELARLGAELDLGEPTGAAVSAWRRRMRSPRVDAFVAALLSQRVAGGDLAGLLRRFAEGAAERYRAAEDARAATSQARFTGLLVVAMPSGGALFAELLQPGFLAKLLGAPASAALLGLAASLQLVGFLAIRHLARVVE
jgi:tight adherence protein B